MSITLQFSAFIAALVIFIRVEPLLNLMTGTCRFGVRLAFWALTVGSAALLLALARGYQPNVATVLVLIGAALLLVVERRVRGLLRAPEHVLRDRRARP